MRFFKEFTLGIKNYWFGLKFILKHKLWWFIIFPVLLFIGIYWMGSYFERLEWSISNDIKRNLSEIDTISGLIRKTIQIIFFDQLYYLFTKFTMYLVILCLAPVLAVVSEKIEHILTGNSYKWNLLQVVKDVKRSAKLNARLILIEYMFILLFLGIGTLLGGDIRYLFIYVLPFTIGFYFYGFGFIDYVNERRRLNIRQSIHFVSKHKGLAIALGSIYSSCFLGFNYLWRKFWSMPIDSNTQILWGTILVILFILAVSAPILAIASATLSMHEIVDLSKNEFAVKAKVPQSSEEPKNQSTETDEQQNNYI